MRVLPVGAACRKASACAPGDPLIDGPIDPHDVLAVLGIKELQRYLVDKIQKVYRSQSVAINDKHIEVICRQMLRSVRVTRVGDTEAPTPNSIARPKPAEIRRHSPMFACQAL